MATDSAYLALMVLTFIVPLVGYFITCLGQQQDEKKQEQCNPFNAFNINKLDADEKRKVHPVLRQNVAITRLFARADLSRPSHQSH